MFEHWSVDLKKKAKHLARLWKKVVTRFNGSGAGWWYPQMHTQYLQTHAVVSPIKSFSNAFCTMKSSQTSWKPYPNAIDLARDLLLSRQAKTGENQSITNWKPRISANTTVISEKVKIFARRLLFCSNLCDFRAGVYNSNCFEGQTRIHKATEGRIMTVTQQWRYLNLARSSF